MRFCLFFLTGLTLVAEPAQRLHMFRTGGPLTEAASGDVAQVASDYLAHVSKARGASPAAIGTAYIAKRYVTEHNGVTHFVYRQRYQGLEVFDSEITLNLDREGRVLNLGGILGDVAAGEAKATTLKDAPALLRAAYRQIDPQREAALMPLGRAKTGGAVGGANNGANSQRMSFGRGPAANEEVTGEPGWISVNGRLRPAWRFFIPDENGVDFYCSIVEAESEIVLSRRNLTRFQRAPRARVFTGNSPQPNPTPGRPSTTAYPFVNRVEVDLTGDAKASPRGWVTGNATSGNNVVGVHNPLGLVFSPTLQPTPANADGNFLFPLELGPGQPAPTAYKEASVTNLFYWANRAHDLFYAAGFDEAAGNYQAENFGRGGVGGDALIASAQAASLSATFANLNNAFYTNRGTDDGTPSGIFMFIGQDLNTGYFTDGSYDNEVIVHEYTHGVSSRLVPQLFGFQNNSMGEAWSDFFSLEFTLADGAPPDGVYPMAEYLFQAFGTGLRSRPTTTQLEVNPITYRELGSVSSFGPEVHADGEIWLQALWDARSQLIKQLGEREGRRRIRLLVIDGMKLSPPNPTMVDARDAILLADRVGFKGESQSQLWTAFAKRGLGALAQSSSPDSLHIVASFERPTPKGQLRFAETKLVHGEPIRILLSDSNNTNESAIVQFTSSSGDVETLPLVREGSLFTGVMRANAFTSPVGVESGALSTLPGDAVSAYYVDYDTGAGAELIQTTVSTTPDYAYGLSQNPTAVTAGTEQALFTRPTARRSLGNALVGLPFAFPFYDKSYRLVRVSGNGLISFGLPSISPCTDEFSLRGVAGIAPLWMEMMYLATAQREENVFYTRGTNSVTFRWAAQTQRLLVGQMPEPVNFAVTLFDDGRIAVNYGDGNSNLINSQLAASALGCASTTPTVGLSAGHEFHAFLPQLLHGHSRLDRTNAVIFPPFGQESIPQVRVEAPQAGDTAAGFVTVTGVTWDSSAVILRTDIYIDGTAVGTVANNLPRADFCATQTVPGCPNIGFSRRFDLGSMRIAPGVHTVQVRATNVRGAIGSSPEVSFTSTAAPATSVIVGAVEAPTAGAEMRYPLAFRGWVHSGSTRVLGVDAVVDGLTAGPATYGGARADICGGLSPMPVNCPGVGAMFTLASPAASVVPLAPGLHRVQWRVRDEFGRVAVVPETPVSFTIPGNANKPPVGVIESIKPNDVLRGTIRVTGYAYDPDGRVLATRLRIGNLGANLQYGIARPDACAQLTAVDRCPNIGFDGTFDTRLLPNGIHNLGVLLFDDFGAVVTIPALGAEGMNVRIEN